MSNLRRITYDMLGGNVREDIFRREDITDEKVIQSIIGTFDEIETHERDGLIQNKDAYTAWWLGCARLYQTFYRNSKDEPYRYAGLCEWNEKRNLHPRTGRRVFIISQFHADDAKEAEFNRSFAKALARAVYLDGDVPVAPHLYFPVFMDDSGIERDWGIEAGHMMMDLCDAAILATIDGRVSKGMASDLEYATEKCGLFPEKMAFTREAAEKFVRTEKDAHEKRSGSEHR